MENYKGLEMTEHNPIQKLVNYSEEKVKGANAQVGPRLLENICFVLKQEEHNDMKVENFEESEKPQFPETKEKDFGISKNSSAFMNSPETKSPKSQSKRRVFCIRRKSISFFSKSSAGLKSKQRLKRTTKSTAISLQDIIFRQKLERFIRNLRTHTSLNDKSKLTMEKLNIINDLGVSKSLVLKDLNSSKGSNEQSWKKLKLKKKSSLKRKLIDTSKKFARNINHPIFSIWRVIFGFIEENIPVLKPFQTFKIIWDFFMLLLTVWNLISYSLVLSFEISLQESFSFSIPYMNNENSLFWFQFICLTLYSADIIMKFNTSFYSDGEPVQNRKRIFKHYLTTGLLFDLMGVLPFWQYFNEIGQTKYQFFLLFKLYPLQVFFKNINEALLSIEGRLEASYYLIKLLLTVLVVCHIFACFWHYQAFQIVPYENSWIMKLNLQTAQWTEKYLRSLYFTVVTMTTVGYGDISPSNTIEYLVAMACMLIGSGLIGFSINSIGAIQKKKNKRDIEFRNKMQVINRYFKKNNVEESLKIRVRKYLEYICKIEDSDNDRRSEEIFKELPTSLREELLTQSRGWGLENVFGKNFKTSTMKKIAQNLCLAQYSKEEWIFEEGNEQENTLYIIAKGAVDLVLNESKTSSKKKPVLLESKKAGEVFGMLDFMLDKPKIFSAKASSICSLLTLSKRKFVEILREEPEDYETYCMMRDKAFLYEDFNLLGIKCRVCKESSHPTTKCSFLTYYPFKNILIKKHLHSYPQNRQFYKRKKCLSFRHTLSISKHVKDSVKNFLLQNNLEANILLAFHSEYTENDALNSETLKDSNNCTDEFLPEPKQVDERGEIEDLNLLDEEAKEMSIVLNSNVVDINQIRQMMEEEFPGDIGITPKSLKNKLSESSKRKANEDLDFHENLRSPGDNHRFSPRKNKEESWIHLRSDDKKSPEKLKSLNSTVTRMTGHKAQNKQEPKEEHDKGAVTDIKQVNSTAPLFNKDFDSAREFTIYFPHNNKKSVLRNFFHRRGGTKPSFKSVKGNISRIINLNLN